MCLSLNCIRIVPPNPRGDDVSLYYHLFLDWGYNMDTIVYQLFSTVCGVFEGLPVRNILKVWSFHKNPHPQSVVLEGTSKNAQCPSFTLLSFFLSFKAFSHFCQNFLVSEISLGNDKRSTVTSHHENFPLFFSNMVGFANLHPALSLRAASSKVKWWQK